TVLFLGAAWLIVGALVLLSPAMMRTSGIAVVAVVVTTLLVRHRLEPLPELDGPVELTATAVGLAVTLGGLHALGVATYKAMAAQRERTSRLRDAIATLEQELEEAHASVIATQENTDRLLAEVSHELRTPLNAVRGYTEIVLEDLENTELVGIQRDLERIHVATSQLLDRIGSMLELAPVDPLGRDVEIVPVDVAGVIADAVGIVARRLDGNRNRLRLEGPSEQPPFCTDLARLRHLVVELLSHASALTRNGFVEVTWRLEESELVMTVTGARAPTGPSSSPPRPPGGDDPRDVGLAGPRRLVASLEGTLEVSAARGAGSTVHIRLPDLDRRVSAAAG
ncbi:MAG: HAMP domain-containing sensor histidine kinase, partial [Myxococcota bacterium]